MERAAKRAQVIAEAYRRYHRGDIDLRALLATVATFRIRP